MNTLPLVIQGGMAAGVSNWRLARAVSILGQLGVVSGTAIDQILVRRLQDGDPGGHMSRAFAHFPYPETADKVWTAWYLAGGKDIDQPYPTLPRVVPDGLPLERVELCVLANFAEVFLAREGHRNPVGINFLERIRWPHLPSLYGAMLAGVDYVLMSAGTPARIPSVLDLLSEHRPATYPLRITDAAAENDIWLDFDPRCLGKVATAPLRRPRFLGIVSSSNAAAVLLSRVTGRVDGFILEGHAGGGHSAPPRGGLQLSPEGEVLYGERDRPDPENMRKFRLPFWLADGYGRPDRLRQALALGATGVQVGTAFAYCEESGLRNNFKYDILRQSATGRARIFTDPLASPLRFPFKTVQVRNTLSEPEVYAMRPRRCDMDYMGEAYRTPEGRAGYRCAAEPLATYVAKGGRVEETLGRKCLCNALLANIGHAQIQESGSGNPGYEEPGLITSGDDVLQVARFLRNGATTYSAADVVRELLTGAGPDARTEPGRQSATTDREDPDPQFGELETSGNRSC